MGEVFFHNDNLVVIAGFQEYDRTTILDESFSLLEEIRQKVHGCLCAPDGAVEAVFMIFTRTSFGKGLSENFLTLLLRFISP